MARTKQATPLGREPSSSYTSKAGRDREREESPLLNGISEKDDAAGKALQGLANGLNSLSIGTQPRKPAPTKEAGALQLLIAVGGIYGSFLTWALLQERLTTTPYYSNLTSTTPSSAPKPELFTYPIFLNTIQSLLAFLSGLFYLHSSTPSSQPTPRIFPNPTKLLPPLLLISLTTSLASPFGYASLKHIDYLTFILAKSCKLLPVMFLHITLFRRTYPLYKYLVVFLVTLGVAVFTLHAQKGKGKKDASALNPDRNTAWGLTLLGINLLFDGLTNCTQDWVFESFKGYGGPQMMCANNLMSLALMSVYLVVEPWVGSTELGRWVGMGNGNGGGELVQALAFMKRHPGVWWDVLGFAACGAVGQVFIFYTLSTFSSLLLVTITVTRKMLTMILSVLMFGHRLHGFQWLGVGLVFGGIGGEAVIQRKEKAAKMRGKGMEKEMGRKGRKEL